MQVRIHDEGVSIIASGFDAYIFATRPNCAWPGSALRHVEGDFALDFDKHGDLVDEDGVPEDTEANEVTAFAEYALMLAAPSLQRAIEQQQARFR